MIRKSLGHKAAEIAGQMAVRLGKRTGASHLPAPFFRAMTSHLVVVLTEAADADTVHANLLVWLDTADEARVRELAGTLAAGQYTNTVDCFA